MAPNTGIVNLPRLTSLRFFAASGVFMYHLCRIYPGMPLKATSTVGYVGVAFFFVLSGFVLTWSTPIYNGACIPLPPGDDGDCVAIAGYAAATDLGCGASQRAVAAILVLT